MFILVNPRKHGGHCPPKSHGHGASGTQPFSCFSIYPQPCALQKFGFSILTGLSVDSDLFGIRVFNRNPRAFPCRITQTATPPHSRPNGFPLGLGLQKKSQNRTQGQHGLHAGSTGPLRFAICSRPRGQGRKERKGRKNYEPTSCVTCGTCVTGSLYHTSASRCPLLR